MDWQIFLLQLQKQSDEWREIRAEYGEGGGDNALKEYDCHAKKLELYPVSYSSFLSRMI